MKNEIHGGDVYRFSGCLDFSANCNPLGTPEGVKRAVRESLDRLGDYPRVDYMPLREAIAAYEGVSADMVICGNGAAELIFSVCRAVEPKHALLVQPTFAEYERALQSMGCGIRSWFLQEKEGFVLGEDFLDALTPEIDMVFLCNPNNPTGILLDLSLLSQIVKRCGECGIFLVVDECFLDFVREPGAHTLKGWLDQTEQLFLLKAFTKRYAMAGMRLGYALTGNRKILERMEENSQPWSISTPAQAAGEAALLEKDYVKAGRELVFAEEAYLKKELKALGFVVYPSQANYIFFQGPEDLFERCVKKGILIRDCSNYPGLTKGFWRIAVRTHEENEVLVKAMREVQEELWQKRS